MNDIERLTTENTRLRHVLQRIADGYDEWHDETGETINWGTTELSREQLMDIAEDALKFGESA